MNIKQLESLYQELAFPQLMPQNKLNIEYVNKWRNDAEKALRIGRHVSIHDIKNRDFKVYLTFPRFFVFQEMGFMLSVFSVVER